MLVGGHTRAVRWLVELADGTRAFVKAGDGSMLRVERAVYDGATGPFLPRLLGSYADDAMVVLAIEDLRDAHWPPPYPEDATPLLATVAEIAQTPCPPELQALPERDGLVWERIGADPTAFLALGACSPDWLERSLPVLIEAESHWQQQGDDLVHNDIWSGNICFIGATHPVLIDWGAAVRAHRRVDLAWTLLQVRIYGCRTELEFPDEPVYAAYASAELAFDAASPLPSWAAPGSTLRLEQARDVPPILRWTADVLGLPPPS